MGDLQRSQTFCSTWVCHVRMLNYARFHEQLQWDANYTQFPTSMVYLPSINEWLITPPKQYPTKNIAGQDLSFITNSMTNWMRTINVTTHLKLGSYPNNFLICGYFSAKERVLLQIHTFRTRKCDTCFAN